MVKHRAFCGSAKGKQGLTIVGTLREVKLTSITGLEMCEICWVVIPVIGGRQGSDRCGYRDNGRQLSSAVTSIAV